MSLRQKDYIIAALAIGGLFVSMVQGWLGAVMLLAALGLYNMWWRCPLRQVSGPQARAPLPVLRQGRGPHREK